MSPSPKSNTCSSDLNNEHPLEHPPDSILLCSTPFFYTTNVTAMLKFVHPGSVVYMFVCEAHILFYDIQYLTHQSFTKIYRS